MISQVDGANPSPYERPGRRYEVEGEEPEVEEDPMKGWVTVQGKRVSGGDGGDVDTREERRKMFKYPYLTWHLRTQAASWEVEWVLLSVAERRGLQRLEDGEAELRRRLRDQKSKVEEWLEREGGGSS